VTGERALSFGGVAEAYDRYRPAPPESAVAWLLPERVERALDVGAGTGALTRRLLDRADAVVAVEPDPRMRAVLGRRQGPVVVGALGQALPLLGGGFDAVFASSAWHWMEGAGALGEVARVLRPGGVFGVVWNGPDRSVPWVRRLFGDHRPAPGQGPRHRLELPPGTPFGPPESHVVDWSVAVGTEELLGLLSTYSRVIVLSEEQRAALAARVRREVAALAGPDGTVRLPLRCRSFRTERH
jgi:SAM-dependent methyltransferase